MRITRKKIFGIILGMTFTFSNTMYTFVSHAESKTDDEIQLQEMIVEDTSIEEYVPEDDSGLSQEECYEGYLTNVFGLNSGISLYSSSYQGDKLSGNEKKAYDYMKTQITRVANGELASSEFSMNLSDFIDLQFTKEELGVSQLVEDSYFSTETKEALSNLLHVDVRKVIYNLLSDCPYELYWYEKTIGCNISTHGYSARVSGDTLTINDGVYLTIAFYVDTNYKADSLEKSTNLDTSKTLVASQSVRNANAIIDEAKNLSDYGKLAYYRKTICDLVSYDRSAAASAGSMCGDIAPWQLIYVFDGNTDTNVVCEGYAKAFQYLCERTVFDSPEIYSYIVTGKTNENHMWNIVHMDDTCNYLVDVTNCDTGTLGSPDKLFLKGYYSEVNDTSGNLLGYNISTGTNLIKYLYDENTMMYFDSSELELSNHDYIQTNAKVALYSSTPDGAASSIAALSGGGLLPMNQSARITANQKDGYNFLGWYKVTSKTEVDGIITLVYAPECLSSSLRFDYTPTCDVELVAIYKPNKEMTVNISGDISAFDMSINGDAFVTKTCPFRSGYSVGTRISVRADETSFSHWENAQGMILSRSATYSFVVTGNMDIHAVYNNNVSHKATVSFVSGYNQIISRELLGKDETPSIPTNPEKTDYAFVGWAINGGDTIAISDISTAITAAVNETLETSDTSDDVITITAKYEIIPSTVAITVTNGNSLEAVTTNYDRHAVVTIIADEVSGKRFSHFENTSGDILSYNATYNFYATMDETIIAKYVSSGTTVQEVGTTNLVAVVKNATEGKVSFVSMSTVPENCIILKAGVIATSDTTIGADAEQFIEDTPNTHVFGDAWNGNAYRYTLTINTSLKIFARAYLVYQDKNGNIHTVYSKIVTSED